MPISCGKSVPDTEVQTLEKMYNVTLPDDYKDFLKEKNGFVVKSPDFSELDYDGVDEGVIAFYALFGINTQNHHHDIKHHNDKFLNEINFIDDKIIIGDDPGGNYFLLINGNDKKGIFYWDRTHLHAEDDVQQFEIAEKNECGNIYKITSNFLEFYEEIIKTTLTQGMKISNDL